MRPTPQSRPSQINRLETTYAQATANQRIQDCPIDSQNISASNYQYQPPQQANDIQELKSMMKSLMEQMSIMLNLLTTLVSKMSQC